MFNYNSSHRGANSLWEEVIFLFRKWERSANGNALLSGGVHEGAQRPSGRFKGSGGNRNPPGVFVLFPQKEQIYKNKFTLKYT